MSFFICPHCGERTGLFAHGGGRHEAERLGVPFLGEVPLHIAIRETSDAGTPVVATDPDGPHAAIYRAIANATWMAVLHEREAGGRPPPRIVLE
jgi:ATP-binding protein involved in chromosome partitioning